MSASFFVPLKVFLPVVCLRPALLPCVFGKYKGTLREEELHSWLATGKLAPHLNGIAQSCCGGFAENPAACEEHMQHMFTCS